jgi:hypothetical protein
MRQRQLVIAEMFNKYFQAFPLHASKKCKTLGVSDYVGGVKMGAHKGKVESSYNFFFFFLARWGAPRGGKIYS